MILLEFFGLALCSITLVQCRGPHHPRGVPVVKRNHIHYQPNPGNYENLIDNDELLHDKAHIEEHLEEMVDIPDLSKMTDEELDFYYFQTHDVDKNNKLDGLEILQAISHIVDESNNITEDDDNNDKEFNYYIRLIDQVLEEDDIDQDGFLDYPEYITSRKNSKNNKMKNDIPVVEIVS